MFIFQSNLSENKSIFIALSLIYGIGLKNSFRISKKLGFSLNLKVKSLTKKQISNLIIAIELENIIISIELKVWIFIKYNNN